jgi:hypothetical protein
MKGNQNLDTIQSNFSVKECRNGILFQKLFCPSVRKKCTDDQKKLILEKNKKSNAGMNTWFRVLC